MKSLMFALLLVTSTSAFAGMAIDRDADAGPSYLSWCTKDHKIVSQNESGQLSTNADCSLQGLKCQELKVQKLNHIYAVCK